MNPISIFVNGRTFCAPKTSLTYDELGVIVGNFGGKDAPLFTVTYRRGPKKSPRGSMVAGQSVRLKNGMIFNVVQTNKA